MNRFRSTILSIVEVVKASSTKKEISVWDRFSTDWNNKMAQGSKEELKHTRKKAERSCTICSNHGIRSMLKGHKRHCPFLNCHCVLCEKGRKKRGVMKKQVRLRRKQMKAIENHRTPCLSTAVEPIQGTRLSLYCLSFY